MERGLAFVALQLDALRGRTADARVLATLTECIEILDTRVADDGLLQQFFTEQGPTVAAEEATRSELRGVLGLDESAAEGLLLTVALRTVRTLADVVNEMTEAAQEPEAQASRAAPRDFSESASRAGSQRRDHDN